MQICSRYCYDAFVLASQCERSVGTGVDDDVLMKARPSIIASNKLIFGTVIKNGCINRNVFRCLVKAPMGEADTNVNAAKVMLISKNPF